MIVLDKRRNMHGRHRFADEMKKGSKPLRYGALAFAVILAGLTVLTIMSGAANDLSSSNQARAGSGQRPAPAPDDPADPGGDPADDPALSGDTNDGPGSPRSMAVAQAAVVAELTSSEIVKASAQAMQQVVTQITRQTSAPAQAPQQQTVPKVPTQTTQQAQAPVVPDIVPPATSTVKTTVTATVAAIPPVTSTPAGGVLAPVCHLVNLQLLCA